MVDMRNENQNENVNHSGDHNSEHKDSKNSLTFEDQVIQKIAGNVANDVKGILKLNGGLFSNFTDRFTNSNDVTKGVDVEVGEKQVALDLEAVVEYGVNIRKVFQELVRKISDAVHNMTGLEVTEVNLNVTDIKTKREFDEENKSSKENKDNDRVN